MRWEFGKWERVVCQSMSFHDLAQSQVLLIRQIKAIHKSQREIKEDHITQIMITCGEARILIGQLFEHLCSSGQSVTRFTNTDVDDQFLNANLAHFCCEFLLLIGLTYEQQVKGFNNKSKNRVLVDAKASKMRMLSSQVHSSFHSMIFHSISFHSMSSTMTLSTALVLSTLLLLPALLPSQCHGQKISWHDMRSKLNCK